MLKKEIFELLNYQFKLLTRSKRTKEMIPLILSGPILVVTLSIFDGVEHYLLLLLTGCLVYFLYSPLLFSWDSGFIKGIETKNILDSDLILSKIIFCAIMNIISIIVVIPFVYFSGYYNLTDVIIFNLFNILFFPFVMTFIASYNNAKVNLNKSRTFNLEGYSFVHLLLTMLPFIIYILISIAVFSFTIDPYIIGIILILLSSINLFYFQKWITIISRNLQKRRYQRILKFKNND